MFAIKYATMKVDLSSRALQCPLRVPSMGYPHHWELGSIWTQLSCSEFRRAIFRFGLAALAMLIHGAFLPDWRQVQIDQLSAL